MLESNKKMVKYPQFPPKTPLLTASCKNRLLSTSNKSPLTPTSALILLSPKKNLSLETQPAAINAPSYSPPYNSQALTPKCPISSLPL
jgi:hypothetical protein